MKILNSVKSILIRGIILLIPLLFIIFIVKTFVGLIEEMIQPIAVLLPSGSLFGYGMTRLTALVIFILVIIISGIFAGTKRGTMMNNKIEALVPGFGILKSILLEHQDMDDKKLKACLATVDDAWLFAFIVEEHQSGMLTVFIPAAPTPTSGNVYVMTEQQVKRLNIPAREVLKYLMQFGAGAKNAIDKNIKW